MDMNGLLGDKSKTADKGGEVEVSVEMGPDKGSLKKDAAGAVAKALGLNPDKLDLSELAAALEDFVACCGDEGEEEA